MEENLETNLTESTPKTFKFGKAALNVLGNSYLNPWGSDEVDRLEFDSKDFKKIIEACRFFYKKDPIASSTINKLVEIGINDLVFGKNGLSENEVRIFHGVKDALLEFAEAMAMEYLISGLVIPEIQYAVAPTSVIKNMGVKKYPALTLPATMWLRNPATVKVKQTLLSDKPSYFVIIPDDVVYFIQNKGKYPDGTEDKELYEQLRTLYPALVEAVLKQVKEIKLDNDLIFRRKPQPDNPYPTPYLLSALEALKHKRNLRRMDYSIASRVISAIQLFKLGSDDFPVGEDQQELFDDLRQQILWRDTQTGKDIERVFQLFANHTLSVEWIYPPVEALLDEKKYANVNQDIIYSLGFPRILITGESEKTGTSDPQYAMMSPSRTMENFRKKILEVIKNIVYQISTLNGLKAVPTVEFKPLTLFDHEMLLKSLADLYGTGNISRTTYANALGYTWNDEMDLREKEIKVMEEKGIPEFAQKPFSNQPGQSQPSDINKQGNNPDGTNK
jgi:hypothetical protein